MRLDKWLKVTLIYKQRSKAVEAIDNNRIRVNGDIAKSAKTIRVGDKITITRELGSYVYTVLSLAEKNVTKVMAREMYDLVAPEETGTEEEKFLKQIEKTQRKISKQDWNQMHDNKRKQRTLRAYKYRHDI